MRGSEGEGEWRMRERPRRPLGYLPTLAVQGLRAAQGLGLLSSPLQVTPLTWEAAQRHGIGAFVAELAQHTPSTIALPLQKMIDQERLRSLGIFLRQRVQLERLLTKLKAEQIDVILLKGIAVASDLYPRPELRPVGDIDLLAHPEQYPHLFMTLSACGFEPVDPSPELPRPRMPAEAPPDRAFIRRDSELTVEVHFTTLQTGLLERYADAIWAERRWLVTSEGIIPALSREHTILMLASHAHKHSYSRLIWLLDLYVAIQAWHTQLNWQKLAVLAREEGIAAIVHYALRQVERAFGAQFKTLHTLRWHEWPVILAYRLLWPLPQLLSSAADEHQRWSRFEPRGRHIADVIGGLVFTGRRREKWQVLTAYATVRAGAVVLPDRQRGRA